MSILKVNGIRGTGASADAITVNATDGTCTIKATNNLSNRNLLINGAMLVAQRGTSSTEDGYKTVDRWQVNYSGEDEDPTQAQVALTTGSPYDLGFRKALKVTNGNQTSGAGAADFARIRYKLESQDLASSGWNYKSASSYITFSFWVKSSVAQNFYVQMKTSDTYDGNYVFETGSLSANTWTKVTKTIPGNASLIFDNDANEGIYIAWHLFRGTDNTGTRPLNAWAAYDSATLTPDQTSTWWTTNDATYELTGVQLEVGDTATDFEHRTFGDELARCKRYYHHWVDSWDSAEHTAGLMFQSYNSTGGHCPLHITPQMRGTPTIKVANATNAWQYIDGGSSDDFDQIAGNSTSLWTDKNVELYASGNLSTTAGQAAFIRCKASPSTTYLAFDAEL